MATGLALRESRERRINYRNAIASGMNVTDDFLRLFLAHYLVERRKRHAQCFGIVVSFAVLVDVIVQLIAALVVEMATDGFFQVFSLCVVSRANEF